MKPSNKIEDQFFGKRVVKEIFAKAKFKEDQTVTGYKNWMKDISVRLEKKIGKLNEARSALKDAQKRLDSNNKNPGHYTIMYSRQDIQKAQDALDNESSFSRTGGKARFEWTKELGSKIQTLKRTIGVAQDNLSSLYSQLKEAYAEAARNSGTQKKDSPYFSRTGSKAKFAIKKIKDLGNGWVVEEANGNDAFNPSATELYLTKGSKTIPVESLKHAIETYNDLITGKKGIYK